jgi:hypothetical protein
VSACVCARTRNKNACARAALVCVHVRVCACFDRALGGGDTVTEVMQLHVVCRVQHLTTGKPMQSRRHGRPHVANVALCQCCMLSDTCALSVACTHSALPKCGRGLSGIYRLAAATSAPGLDSPQPCPPGAWLRLPRLARGAPAAKVRIEVRRGSRARACAAELGVLALAAPWRVDLRVRVPRRDSTGGGV